MFRKVKQTIAGLYALRADNNSKKASIAKQNYEKYKGTDWGYVAWLDYQNRTRKASRQYAKASKLMWY